MTKLMIIPKNKEFDELINDSDAFLIGIENMSINMPIYFNIDEIGLISEKLHKKKKKLFISLNKNMHNKDLKELERILTILNDLKIEGVFYYDVAILSIVRRLKLDLKLVWSSEHLTTNYATINFWKDMKIDYTYLSAEITLDEIIEISKCLMPCKDNLFIFQNRFNFVIVFHLVLRNNSNCSIDSLVKCIGCFSNHIICRTN